MKDIYSMKESVYIEDKKNELERTASTKKTYGCSTDCFSDIDCFT